MIFDPKICKNCKHFSESYVQNDLFGRYSYFKTCGILDNHIEVNHPKLYFQKKRKPRMVNIRLNKTQKEKLSQSCPMYLEHIVGNKR